MAWPLLQWLCQIHLRIYQSPFTQGLLTRHQAAGPALMSAVTSWLHHEKTKQKGLLDLSAGSGKWYRDLDNTNQTFELVSSMFSFQVFRCFGSFFQVLFQTAAHCMVNQGHAISIIFVWKLGEIVSQDSGSSSIAYEKKGTR